MHFADEEIGPAIIVAPFLLFECSELYQGGPRRCFLFSSRLSPSIIVVIVAYFCECNASLLSLVGILSGDCCVACVNVVETRRFFKVGVKRSHPARARMIYVCIYIYFLFSSSLSLSLSVRMIVRMKTVPKARVLLLPFFSWMDGQNSRFV